MRATGRKPLLGSSAASPPVPEELKPLLPLSEAVTKSASAVAAATPPSLDADYTTLVDPATSSGAPAPSAPIRAARLSALLKALGSAEGAVRTGIAARQELVTALESLITEQRRVIERVKGEAAGLKRKRDEVEGKKREVEDEILRGLPAQDADDDAYEAELAVPSVGEPSAPQASNGVNSGGGVPGVAGTAPMNGTRDASASASVEPERPQVEALTPPPASPGANLPEPGTPIAFDVGMGAHGFDEDGEDGALFKRQRTDGGMHFGGFVDGDAMADLDADVSELLRTEGGSR